MTAVHPAAAALIAFGRDQLPAAEAAAVRRHLDGCEACRRRAAGGETSPAGGTDVFAGVSQVVRGLADLPTVDHVPDELKGLTQYADLKELGRGGMGVVYLARHTLLDRPVVLKVASRELLAKAGGDAAERFLREMRSAAKLHHPNVVAAYDAVRHGDVLVFVMEYAHGEDLAKVLARKGPLPVPTACFYAHCVALGLQHAHDHGLVHRDIKPANLIQVKTGTKAVVKVLDFGLAKVTREAGGAGPTVTNMGMGTPQYMAPEQWRDAGGVGIQADIYALGGTLYCLLTGTPPFRGNQFELMLAHCDTPPPAVRHRRPDVPAELAAVVAKMLAKDPAARFQTPAEVATALRPFIRPAAKSGGEAQPQPVRQVTTVHDSAQTAPAVAPAARRRWVWPAVAVGVVLVGLTAAMAGGVFKAKTPHGTLVIENVPADAVVLLDGSTATVTRNGETVTLTAMRGPHALKVVQGGNELLAKDEVVVTVDGEPVRVRVEPPAADPDPLLPDKSVWAGTTVGTQADGKSWRSGSTFTVVERRGRSFKWLARSFGYTVLMEGVIDAGGRVTIEEHQQLRPEVKTVRVKGTGELSHNRLTRVWEAPDTGHTFRGEWKRLPDGGAGFDFTGRWRCTHQPDNWVGFRTVTPGRHSTDRPRGDGVWERDGGLLVVHFPNGGREWLVIDPDDPDRLAGSNGPQAVTWQRQ